jgi:hypothetical protein
MSAPRNPWPIAIGMFIGLFFLSMTAFVVWSLGHRQDLVFDDYYERELQHNDVIERTARAAGLRALRHDARAQELVIDVPEGAGDLALALYRPSDAKLDRTETLVRSEPGPIRYSTRGLAPGLWRATLEWTLDDAGYRTTLAFIVE